MPSSFRLAVNVLIVVQLLWLYVVIRQRLWGTNSFTSSTVNHPSSLVKMEQQLTPDPPVDIAMPLKAGTVHAPLPAPPPPSLPPPPLPQLQQFRLPTFPKPPTPPESTATAQRSLRDQIAMGAEPSTSERSIPKKNTIEAVTDQHLPVESTKASALRQRKYLCAKYPSACRCDAIDPETLIYNRIPKAGSGSMNVFLGEAKHNHRMPFDLCMSKLYHDRLLRGPNAKRYAKNPITASGCRRTKAHNRTVLSRHVFYLNFSQYQTAEEQERERGAQSPSSLMAHFNVMRDPVGRCVSRFYYERDARGTFGHDETLDECMAPNGRCKFEAWKEPEVSSWIIISIHPSLRPSPRRII